MKNNILSYINKLQSYKTAIKNLHWSSKRMSEHKLLDDIADSVASNQDEIAEIAQGIYGKIKNNEVKPRRYKIYNSKRMLSDMLKDTKDFHATINGKELIGLRSVVESFIGELNKFNYLIDMCLKEDFKRNYKLKNLNESKDNMKIKLSENKLRSVIREAINNVVVNESNSSIKKMVINKLHKSLKGISSGLFRDESWQAVSEAYHIMEQVIGGDGEVEMWVENGGYWKPLGEFPNYKAYKIRITLNNGIEIGGELKCHAAGSMEDTFDRYDVTITFW